MRPVGGGQISSKLESGRPAPLSLRDFFPLGEYFGCYPVDCFATWNLETKKILAALDTYKSDVADGPLAPPKIEYLFSAGS